KGYFASITSVVTISRSHDSHINDCQIVIPLSSSFPHTIQPLIAQDITILHFSLTWFTNISIPNRDDLFFWHATNRPIFHLVFQSQLTLSYSYDIRSMNKKGHLYTL